MKEISTVSIYLLKDDKVLLIYRNKKEHDINHNKYIGVGGHIEEGETPDAAIDREVKEETNFDIISKKFRAIITFHFDEFIEHMYLYTSDDFKGTQIEECNEGDLEWIDISKLDSIPMWEGDKYFVNPILKENAPYMELEMFYEGDKLIKVIQFIFLYLRDNRYLYIDQYGRVH